MSENFPCVCGHPKIDHETRFESITDSGVLCKSCFEKVKSRYDCNYEHWHPFKPDNLKYLENKYKEKNKWKKLLHFCF